MAAMTTASFRGAAGIGLAIGLFGLSLSARAAPSFHSDQNYPNLGLRVRVLSNSSPEPLAHHQTFTYTFTRGGEDCKRDLFDPRELWYATQHAGQWRDKNGNLLVLGRPTRLLPAFGARHVSREDFDKTLADPRMAFEGAGALPKWVEAFASCAPQPAEALPVKFSNLAEAAFFPVEDPALLIYAFRVKTRMPDGQIAPSGWFVAVLTIGDGTLKSKARRIFETQFLADAAAAPQDGAASAAGVQSRILAVRPTPAKTPSNGIPEHPSRIAARKSIANMKGWWYSETPEYVFLSNIRGAAGKSLVRELQASMPVLRDAFARLIPPFEDSTDVSVMRIYEDPEAYRHYVGRDFEWSSGVWSPMRRELVILAREQDKSATMAIIRHEGFHQYLFYATGMIGNAAWFDEGHACFFESAELDSKGRIKIPENYRVGLLLDNLDGAARGIPRLLQAEHSDFYGGSDRQRALNYASAWALVYFLRKGAPAAKLAAYTSIPDKYLQALAAYGDAESATADAFEGVSMADFQEDFIGFWKQNRGVALRFDPFAGKEPASGSWQ